MKQETIEDILARDEGSIRDVVHTLERLMKELRTDRESWENPTLDRYLEAMAAWLLAFESRLGPKPSWKAIAMMLDSAKFYE